VQVASRLICGEPTGASRRVKPSNKTVHRTRIKLCGITTVEDAALACQLGADAIGLNLYTGSKRCVTPETALQIAQNLPPFVEPVVLFVNEALHQALEIAEPISRTIQWHGEKHPLPPPLPWRFIPAFPIAEAADLEAVSEYLRRCREANRLPTAVLLDGYMTGKYGGTGLTAPWSLLAGFNPGVPVILAGGLTPENVAEAVRLVHPYGVDVASGVESAPGRKDADKLRRFIAAANAASARPVGH
jgi:phosphoribosylanthranilate isomerase